MDVQVAEGSAAERVLRKPHHAEYLNGLGRAARAPRSNRGSEGSSELEQTGAEAPSGADGSGRRQGVSLEGILHRPRLSTWRLLPI